MKKIIEKEERRKTRAKAIFDNFSFAISNIRADISFCSVVDVIISCEGLIITTGMGKAGLVMKKFSAMLCSLGIPSCYLHPGEAMHGDLGIISNKHKDVLFVASTSGKTKEILDLMDLIKDLNLKSVVGITSHPDSPLRNKTNYLIDMGNICEAGELKLSPTTSTLVMMATTDALALVASEEKGFKKEDFSKFHHGGYLGKIARGDSKIY